MFLTQFFDDVYCPARPQSRDGLLTYRAAISKLEDFAGRRLLVSDLTEPLVQGFLNAYRQEWSAASTNNKRKHLLALWRFAARKKLADFPDADAIPRFKTPKRQPTAWSPAEYGRLLKACWEMRKLSYRGVEWNGWCWRAFLLLQYDTSHRRGALLSYPNADPPVLTTPRDAVQDGCLTVRAEHTKHNGDTTHKLHKDTLEAIKAMPEHELLLPWPRGERLFDSEYNVLLAYAGMKTGRENHSHKNRRTSVTQVAAKRGVAAASMHARHSSESVTVKSYIDARFLPVESATDFMERPSIDS